MSSRKIRTVENLILLTFPLVLFVGCAGSDVKPVNEEMTQLSMTKPQTTEFNGSLLEPDTTSVSLAKSDIEPHIAIEPTTQISQTDTKNAVSSEHDQSALIALKIPDNKIFFFDTNIYKLSEQQREQLKLHAEYLKANPASVLVINGHADERGTENYNQALSEKRAKETFELLISLGVASDQLLKKGYGELVPMHSESNWDENRRVELEYTDPMMLSSM